MRSSLHAAFGRAVSEYLRACLQRNPRDRATSTALLEYAWSYGLDKSEGTSTAASSAALQLAHAILLYAIWRAPSPPVYCAAAAEIDDDDAGRRGRKRE